MATEARPELTCRFRYPLIRAMIVYFEETKPAEMILWHCRAGFHGSRSTNEHQPKHRSSDSWARHIIKPDQLHDEKLVRSSSIKIIAIH